MEPRLAPELEEALAVLIGQMPGAAPPLSARDLADAVWLASVVPSARPELKDDPTKISPPPVNPEDQKTTPDSTTPTAEKAINPPPPAPGPPAPKSEQKLLYPKPVAGDLPPYAVPATELLSPTARAVPGLRSLAGALRPLMRKVPQPGTFRLDEDATVEKWSELLLAREPGCFPLWPVLKPGLMREWEIVLLVDRAPGMRVWSGVAEELSALLQWQGAFRGVHLWEMETTGTEPLPSLTPRAGGTPRAPTELLSARGDRLIVALTDGMAPAWTEGRALDLLGELGRRGPVAVWQVLPEHLWRLTGFGTPGWDVTPLAPGTSNSGLAARRRTEEWDTPESSAPDAELLRKTVPLPLVSLTPAAMGRWARLVMGLGHSSLPAIRVAPRVPLRGYRGLRPEAAAAAAVAKPEPVAAPDPERLLAEFRTQITPTARRLAGLLAYVPLTIPIMRVVQQAMLPTSNQGHLAEFLMSGLAYPVDGERFEFYPGIRERLVRTVTLQSTLEVQEAVGRRLGLPPETVRQFAAYAVDADAEPGETGLSPDQLPFAKLAAEALRELRLVKPASIAVEPGEPSASETTPANLTAPFGFRLRSESHLDLGKLSLVTWMRNWWLAVGVVDGPTKIWPFQFFVESEAWDSANELHRMDGRPVQVLGAYRRADVLVVTSNGSLFCLNPHSGQPNYQLRSQLNSWESSAFDASEVAPGASQTTWPIIHVPNAITCAAPNPNGEMLATGDVEGYLSLRDAVSGHMINPQIEPAAIRALAWRPDGEVLAAASDHDFTVTLWSEGRFLVRRLRAHATTIRCLAWSPDSARLISADADGVIGIWNTSNLPSVDDDGSEVVSVPQDLTPHLIRCPAGVSALSFSPDGRVLAATGEDGRLQLWRTDSWQVVGELRGYPSAPGVSMRAFHPVEPVLAVLAENGEAVRLWDVDVEMLLASEDVSDSEPVEPNAVASRRVLAHFRDQEREIAELIVPLLSESSLIIVDQLLTALLDGQLPKTALQALRQVAGPSLTEILTRNSVSSALQETLNQISRRYGHRFLTGENSALLLLLAPAFIIDLRLAPGSFLGASWSLLCSSVGIPHGGWLVPPETEQSPDTNITIRTADGSEDNHAAARALALRYEEIRRTQPPGSARTSRLWDITREMRAHAAALRDSCSDFAQSELAGERLIAVVILQNYPRCEYLEWLGRRFAVEKPFIIYQSCLALQAAVKGLELEHREKLQATLQAARAFIPEDDTHDHLQLIESAERQLKRRLANEAAGEPKTTMIDSTGHLPLHDMSSDDLNQVIENVQSALPYGAAQKYDLLQIALAEVPANLRDLLLGNLNLEGPPRPVALSVVMGLIRAGQPVKGREALGFLLRGLSYYIVDVNRRAWLDRLFLRYALDERVADAPLPAPEWKAASVPQSEHEVMAGEASFTPVYYLAGMADAMKAVVHLNTPQGMGTGFLVGDGLVMTCNHVVPKARDLEATFLTFNYQLGPDGNPLPEIDAVPDTTGPFYTSPAAELDFTVFAVEMGKLSAPLPAGTQPLRLRPGGAAVGDRVTIIQHPGGGRKVVSFRNNLVQYLDDRVLQYTTSTLKGSSGAPVLNDQAEVVGVHNKGGDTLVEPASGKQFKRNEGSRIEAILDELQQNADGIYQRLTLPG